jgi:hypothetical protein
MLQQFPPMGVYETLFKFADRTAKYMGDPGTHPWAQGYPLTTQIPGGPPLPAQIDIAAADLKYPKATGEIELREAIANYYNEHYAAGITPDHVAIFAGGRPGIFAILAFMEADIGIAVEETEYTPYFDMLERLQKTVKLISSNAANEFRPGTGDYDIACSDSSRTFLVKSNPCNPTGVAITGDALASLVRKFSGAGRGALFDEAYEFYNDPEPESALRHIDDTSKSSATTRLLAWVAFHVRHNCMLRSCLSRRVFDKPARPSQRFLRNKGSVTAMDWRSWASNCIRATAGSTIGASCLASCPRMNSMNACSNMRPVFCPAIFAIWRDANPRMARCTALSVFPSAP